MNLPEVERGACWNFAHSYADSSFLTFCKQDNSNNHMKNPCAALGYLMTLYIIVLNKSLLIDMWPPWTLHKELLRTQWEEKLQLISSMESISINCEDWLPHAENSNDSCHYGTSKNQDNSTKQCKSHSWKKKKQRVKTESLLAGVFQDYSK